LPAYYATRLLLRHGVTASPSEKSVKAYQLRKNR